MRQPSARFIAVFLACACTATTALADLATVVPNSLAQTPANALFNGLVSNANAGGGLTYQLLVDSSQLTAHQGRLINGLRFRQPTSASADRPFGDISFASYAILLSPGIDPSARGFTFAENVVGAQILVRSGQLDILASAFDSGSSPNAFGHLITFQTPYAYGGGDLLIEIRQSGFSGVAGLFVDATTSVASGYGSAVAAAWGSGYAATNGQFAAAAVTEITSAVPEPSRALLVLAGLGMVAGIASRKRGRSR